MIHNHTENHNHNYTCNCNCDCNGGSGYTPSSSGGSGCLGDIVSVIATVSIYVLILSKLGISSSEVPLIVDLLVVGIGSLIIRLIIIVIQTWLGF